MYEIIRSWFLSKNDKNRKMCYCRRRLRGDTISVILFFVASQVIFSELISSVQTFHVLKDSMIHV